MKTAFIFHGILGYPEENWFPWLTQELEHMGYVASVPAFPNPNMPRLDEWMDFFVKKYADTINAETVLIGHSLGTAFALAVVERYPTRALFSVAGFTDEMHNEFANDMKTFTDHPFDWDAIRANCQRFYVLHGSNDPYVPVQKAKDLSAQLDCDLTLIEGAGHCNAAAGYTEFPLLLDMIKQLDNEK